MSYSQILYDVEDGVLTITMNRPEKLNAFTGTMMTEMIDAFDRSDADDSIRAVIVTGAGRAFCAGADLARWRRHVRCRRPRRSAERTQPRRRWPADAAHFRQQKAGDRRSERTRGRDRRDDDARDGHPSRGRRRAVRVRIRAARHRAGGVFELVPAACSRDQPRARMGVFGPRFRCRRSARRVDSSAASIQRIN